MSRRRSSTRGRILKVDLESFATDPLHRRIYLSIRRDIVDGILLPGADLPSTRTLSVDLDVSRGTVVMAYEQLRAEGYLEADAGGGTRVTYQIPDLCVNAVPDAASSSDGRPQHRASRRGQNLADGLSDIPFDLRATGPRAFRSTPPAIDVFPVDTWTRIASRQWRRATTRDLSYGAPMGYPPLRRAIAEYVRATRGVRCTWDQILVVAGAQQGMDIAARALLDPGDEAWVEDPGYFGTRGALLGANAAIVPVGVDEHGIDVAEGRRLAPNARIAFVTPSHQVPLGVALSVERRTQLLEWADESNAWIFEDDYNSDFQYTTRPTAALQAVDRSGRVIYCGTFNKSLFPGLRIGFLVVPECVLPAFVGTRYFTDIQQSYLDQATLAEFISAGHYERHIRRLRSIYQARRELLQAGLEQFTRWLTPGRADSGREMTVSLKQQIDDTLFARAAERSGVYVLAVSPLALTHRVHPGLRLGYSGIDEADIQAGIQSLAAVFESFGRGHPFRDGSRLIAAS